MIDPKKIKSTATFKHSGTLFCLCRDTETGHLLAGSSDYKIHVFDPESKDKKPLATWAGHDNYVWGLACLSGAGNQIVSAGFDRRLIWWRRDTGEAVKIVNDAHAGWIRDLRVLPDGRRFATVGDDMLVKLWDGESGELLRTFDGHARKTPQGHVTALYVVAVSSNGQELASCDRVGEIRVWETESGKLLQSFRSPTLYTYDPKQRKRSIGGIRSAAFSLDGATLAVGGIGQIGNVDGLGGPAHVEIWNWREGKKIVETNAGHKAFVHDLTFSAELPYLIGAGGGADDALIAFWDTKDPKYALVHKQKTGGHFHALVLDTKNEKLYTAGHEKLEVWGMGVA